MSKKTKYVPPTAELILLAPCENLASSWDWGFKETWRSTWGRIPAANGLASGVAFGGEIFDSTDQSESGFIIKTK